MASGIVTRPTLDVSGLPNVVFGHRSILWYATFSLAAIEGAFLCLLLMSYYFLRTRAIEWPPGVLPPYMLYGTVNLVLFAVSGIPNQMVKKASTRGDLRTVRWGLVATALFGLAILVLRGFEFLSLNVRWDANAYGSAVWVLLGFHTMHLLTDWVDTLVIMALFFTDRVEGKRYMDAYENSDYWYFILLMWPPIYLTIYWAPRWL